MTNTSQRVGWKNLSYNHLGDLWRCFDAGTLMAWHHALFAKAGGVTARRFHSAPGFAPLRSEDFRLMNQNIAESLRRLYSRSAIRNIKELVGPLATCRCEASIKSGGIEAILVWIPSLDSAVHTFWSHDLISNCLNKLHVPYCHSTLWRNVHILYDCVNNIATSCNNGNNKHTHIIYLLYGVWRSFYLLNHFLPHRRCFEVCWLTALGAGVTCVIQASFRSCIRIGVTSVSSAVVQLDSGFRIGNPLVMPPSLPAFLHTSEWNLFESIY